MSSTNYQRLRAGLCSDCSGNLAHGPYSDEQIAAACDDIGMPVQDFCDVCDDCFLREIARGDVKYAEKLIRRPLQLSNKGVVFAILLGGANV